MMAQRLSKLRFRSTLMCPRKKVRQNVFVVSSTNLSWFW